ncbi:YopT-type cysteine protease domain-containing protein [Bradyrhizobium sp. WSM2254]|uniref:YopT-type cysteine protease domain-containing protein n=1 Tax=Bradyrhizobium sp. WSM2254 TaxID=1188263 RepID=UPI0006762420|nr:YopT-type cysteine protease domain-containing protein [Bradyrhizobium sp. WSM2254]
MHIQISASSTGAHQADESSQSMDDCNFAGRLADLALQGKLSPGGACDKMGLCCSKPHTSDAHIPTPSSFRSTPPSSSPGSSPSPSERPVIPLFAYRTAALRGANVDGICAGLAAEWLLNLPSSPSSRMSALRPGSQTYASAAMRQQRYEELKDRLQSNEAEGPQPKDIMLQEAGLQPSERRIGYEFSRSSEIAGIVNEVTEDPSVYLLSLRFPEGWPGHLVATSTSNGMTTLFDPNYGEFAVASDQVGDLLRSFADDCTNDSGRYVVTVVTQRMS